MEDLQSCAAMGLKLEQGQERRRIAAVLVRDREAGGQHIGCGRADDANLDKQGTSGRKTCGADKEAEHFVKI